MRIQSHKDRVDALISQIWKSGYLTISRKYGKFLPPPKPIGEFDVDVVAKYKRKYMIGLLINEKDIADPKLTNKLIYLSSRNTKYTNEKVTLLLGVSDKNKDALKEIIDKLPEENRRQIKIYQVVVN
ncbi:MAG: hypothetical protein Fur0015_04190 [Ignavibacteriales bacterium]